MKRNQTRRTIYIRTFGALVATYLVLMAAFTVFLIEQEKKVESIGFRSFAAQVNKTVANVLQDYIDDQNEVADPDEVRKALVARLPLFNIAGTEVAMYTEDGVSINTYNFGGTTKTATFTANYNLLFNSKGHWLCRYAEPPAPPEPGEAAIYNYNQYGCLDPEAWFNAKEAAELENYLYAKPNVQKIGDLSGYSVELEGFWVDNEMIIPDRISVLPMYARSLDENGVPSGSSSNREEKIFYASGYHDNKGLPYYENGIISPVHNGYRNSKTQIAIRNMVLDQEKLEKALEGIYLHERPMDASSYESVYAFTHESCERVNFFTCRYYLIQPYQNTEKSRLAHSSNKVWTALAREVNLWEQCALTLTFVWVSCLLAFMIVAFILSAQTYRTYQKREELERFRQETTHALAHDLKTPLSIISGYAQNLIENVHTEKREHYAGGIQAQVGRMDKIIREMLELSRLESGLLSVKFEDVALGAVCARIMERYKPLCDEKSIAASLEGDAVVKAEQALMARVIDNFFVNALANTPAGGIIRISIGDNKLEVYNSGSHIPAEKINEIWMPYVKLDGSRSRTNGTGLGLAIARTILELHGFSYGVTNRDHGVIFWFEIN